MAGSLVGKRILVVEDEYYIATDLRRFLQKEGAIVVGPVGDVEGALSFAEQPLHAAMLDVNLTGVTSFAVADRLKQRAVPYLFFTGYDKWTLPERYGDVPHITKPFSTQSVLRLIEQLLDAETAP